MTNEEEVRSYWEFAYEPPSQPQTSLVMWLSGRHEIQAKTRASLWEAALAYTNEHKEKVRQVDAAIAWVNSEIWADSLCDSPSDADEPKYILARLQEIRETLLKGVRRTT